MTVTTITPPEHTNIPPALRAQADPNADTAGLLERYGKVQVRDFDGDPARLTEMATPLTVRLVASEIWAGLALAGAVVAGAAVWARAGPASRAREISGEARRIGRILGAAHEERL